MNFSAEWQSSRTCQSVICKSIRFLLFIMQPMRLKAFSVLFVSCFDTGLDSAFHIRKKFTLFQLLSASPKKRQGHTQCMHLVHTSFTSENNMGKILSLTKSIFDIKMMVKSSVIEKKSSCWSVQYKKRKLELAQLSGISKGTCII